jgi:hypothetical protein
MLSKIKEAILKHLHIIYWHALVHNRWPVARWGRQCQAKDKRTVENKSDPCHYPSKTRGQKDGTGEVLRKFIVALKKLYPHREHPPPLVRR